MGVAVTAFFKRGMLRLEMALRNMFFFEVTEIGVFGSETSIKLGNVKIRHTMMISLRKNQETLSSFLTTVLDLWLDFQSCRHPT